MRFLAVIQARSGSTRLPGKVLLPIGPHSLAGHIASRLQKISLPFVFALPAEEVDQPSQLCQHLQQQGLMIAAGPLDDVLQRYIDASSDLADSDYVIRLTGDNPFFDFEALQILLQILPLRKPDLAYLKGLPLGMGFEAIRAGSLRSQKKEELLPHHLEHVSTHIKENPQKFDVFYFDLFARVPEIRLTVDEADDYQLAQRVWQHFSGTDNPFFCAKEIYQLHAQDPDFFQLNRHVRQKPATSAVLNPHIVAITANSPYYGSGHLQRLLMLQQAAENSPFDFEIVLWNDDQKQPHCPPASLVLLDRRDSAFPLQIKKEQSFLLALDNRGEGRKQADLALDTLPHPGMNLDEFKSSLQHFLLSPRLASEKNRADFCQIHYLGLANEKMLTELKEGKNEKRLLLLPTENNHSRLPAEDFYRQLVKKRQVCCYYGQTFFESIYLGKEIFLYAVSAYHARLSEYFLQNWKKLENPASYLDGRGSERMLQLLQKQAFSHSAASGQKS